MSKSRFQSLVESFPSLRRAPGAVPWDAMKFLGWLCSTGLSHGELLAGMSTPAAAKRFDVLEAAAVWDRAHLDAVQAWLKEPFWP